MKTILKSQRMLVRTIFLIAVCLCFFLSQAFAGQDLEEANAKLPERNNPKNHLIPVRFTPHSPVASLADLNKQLDKKVDMSKSGGELELTSEQGQKIKVNTCREYLRLTDQRYAPYTTYDIAMESWFIQACEPIVLLKNAKRSKVSFVKDFNFSRDPLTYLPLDLGLILSSDDREDVERAKQQGKSWKDFYPGTKIELKDKYDVKLTTKDEHGKSEIYLTIFAYGDFNSDGFEDILVYVAYHISEGTFSNHGFKLLTRFAQDGKLELRLP